jgi:hypothetical protein
MDLYLVSLATGAVGLGAMAIGGLSHGIGGHAHTGHGHATGGHAGHSGHAGHGHAGHPHSEGQGSSGWTWSSLLSPRVLFAAMTGFGAIGLAAAPLGEPIQFGVALAGAAAFELFLVGPLWRFLFKFESRAALTLESTVEDEARAVTSFDANGNGLVSVDVDGQLVQLLAILAPDDRDRGVRVRRGDLVRVADVDAARGRCTVTTLR